MRMMRTRVILRELCVCEEGFCLFSGLNEMLSCFGLAWGTAYVDREPEKLRTSTKNMTRSKIA